VRQYSYPGLLIDISFAGVTSAFIVHDLLIDGFPSVEEAFTHVGGDCPPAKRDDHIAGLTSTRLVGDGITVAQSTHDCPSHVT
jgi:hypothetical protein